MELLSNHLLSLLFVCVKLVDPLVIVRAPSPKTAMVGKEPVSVECSYRASGSDIVLGINWYRKTTFDKDFKLIAQIPNKDLTDLPPTFVDKHLESKGNISIISQGIFKIIKLDIKPAECIDEGTYQCEVQVYGGQEPHKPKVQVHLNEEPSVPSLEQEPTVLVENQPVTFTCTGTMGRPVGAFRWIVYKNTYRNPHEEVEMSGITSFSNIAGSCSPLGKSTLAIMITRADQKVKCIVQQHAKEEVVEVSDERVLDVQYAVRDTEVYTKVNNIDIPLSEEIDVIEGDDVYYKCMARGNPLPKFKWSYLPLNGKKPYKKLLSLAAAYEMTIKNVSANHSGSYVCIATNYVDDRERTETTSVRLVIKDKSIYGIQRLRRQNAVKSNVEKYILIGGIVAGAMLFAVTVSLLSVLCYRRCTRNPDQRQVRYQGVKA